MNNYPLGEVICYQGKKCICLYPDNSSKPGYGFDINSGSLVEKCLTAHEDSHYNDGKNTYCPSCCDDMGNTPFPPAPPPVNGIPQMTINTECEAYEAALQCMGDTPEPGDENNWKCYMKHIRKKMEENDCPNTPQPRQDDPGDGECVPGS